MDLPQKRYMNVKDVAAYIGVSPAQIYKMWNKRQIPAAKIGVLLRFDRLEIDEMMRKLLVKPIKRDRNYITERPIGIKKDHNLPLPDNNLSADYVIDNIKTIS